MSYSPPTPAVGAPRASGRRRCAKAWGSREVGMCSPAAGPRPGRAPSPDLGGEFCFCFLSVLLGVDSVRLGLSGRFGEIYIYIIFFFPPCCCCFISKRTTACIGAGRAEPGGVLRQGMPQHGGPSPLEDEGGQCARARLEGRDEGTATSPAEGMAGVRAWSEECLSLFFAVLSPTPTRMPTHTHRSSSGWVFFPALARGAGRALFAAVEDTAVHCPRRCVQGEGVGLFGVLLGLFRRQRGTWWCGRAAGRSRGACCPWAALLRGKWLQTLQLRCLHGGFSLTGYPGLAGMAGHVLGLGTLHRGISFHSHSPTHTDFLDTEVGRICFQIPFLRKSESRGLMEERVTLWKPTCYLPASPTSLSVPGLGTGGICRWLCHLLAAREVVVAGTYPFSIATK